MNKKNTENKECEDDYVFTPHDVDTIRTIIQYHLASEAYERFKRENVELMRKNYSAYFDKLKSIQYCLRRNERHYEELNTRDITAYNRTINGLVERFGFEEVCNKFKIKVVVVDG